MTWEVRSRWEFHVAMTCAGVGTPRYRHGCERRVSFPRRAKSTYDSRRKLPLIETSKTSVDPTPPITLAYAYRIIRIDERAANETLTGRFVTFQYIETTGRLPTRRRYSKTLFARSQRRNRNRQTCE